MFRGTGGRTGGDGVHGPVCESKEKRWRKFRGRVVIQRASSGDTASWRRVCGSGRIIRVADYGEMAETILHFASDEDYYERMSRLAEERAEQLMDSKNSFCGVIDELELDMN